eukprot:402771_1
MQTLRMSLYYWTCNICETTNTIDKTQCKLCLNSFYYISPKSKNFEYKNDKEQLLVNGFIRDIDSSSFIDKFIATSVIQICYAFYFVPFQLFLYQKNKSNIFITNMKIKSISNLMKLSLSKNIPLSCWCYIPMISNSVTISNITCMDKNKCYDGIIGISECGPSYPFITLFESNYTYTQCKNHTFIANQYVPTYSIKKYIENYPLLYCGNKHGIIYEHNSILYQLNLFEIDLYYGNWFFHKLNDESYWYNSNSIFDGKYLSMCYLKSDEKIFGITSYQKNNLKIKGNTAKCGIFDFNRLSWKCIADYKYKLKVNSLDITVCGNNNRYRNNVFSVSNLGCFSKIDLSKNKWINLCGDNKEINCCVKPMIWFENNPFVMYCMHHSKSSNSYFGYFDMRSSKIWEKIDDLQFIKDQMGGITYHAFG